MSQSNDLLDAVKTDSADGEVDVTESTRKPEVKTVPRYNPVPVRGEPVSTTILRDRGSI